MESSRIYLTENGFVIAVALVLALVLVGPISPRNSARARLLSVVSLIILTKDRSHSIVVQCHAGTRAAGEPPINAPSFDLKARPAILK